jgi:ATP-dependent Lon protease
MVLHFDIGRDKSARALNDAAENGRKVFLTAQSEVSDDNPSADGLYQIGVVAEIKQIIRVQQGGFRVMVEGLHRAKIISIEQEEPYFIAQVRSLPTRRLTSSSGDLVSALIRTVKNLFEQYSELSPKMPKELMMGVMVSDDPLALSEYVAGNMPLPVEEKQEILAESSVLRRLEILAEILENEIQILGLERDIYEKVKGQINKNQREYYLREQMRVISEELGEDESPETEISEYLQKIEALKLEPEAHEKLVKEANRLAKLPYNSHESGVVRGYLDTCLELPWNTVTTVRSDIKEAGRVLERDHYGMKKVKERILESIAVRTLSPEMKGQILCLIGPPGVGKTSVAKSIAKATGRNYVRLSLGGVRDESDIRGHRKTYIGSMPGRIIDAIRRAKSKNPLVLLDEVDKLGEGIHGDPSAALLEVLDSEQNHAFRDHYIELPFDLSQVLFIATANNADTIPAPLSDRMEVIDLPSYTREEKFNIAKKHLIPKQRKRHGLTGAQVRMEDEAIYALVDFYTREAGVRRLERACASVFRKCAKRIVAGEVKRITVHARDLADILGPKKYLPESLLSADEVGVVNGLAWTSVGGELMQVEVAVLEGTGKLELTGSLGEVMKESAHAAISYIRAHAAQYGIDTSFYKTKDIHIHVPEGAVPKDGPSAGVTICTALISALSEISVRRDVAMTGEITLRGRVLPIGGLREKAMAAYRAGVKTIIIPEENEPDLVELDSVVRDAIHFVPARHIETVLDEALTAHALNLVQYPLGAPAVDGAARLPVTC